MATLNLRTGDKVEWNIGLLSRVTMRGAVLEDFGDMVDIISHTKNGSPHVIILTVDKSKLKFY